MCTEEPLFLKVSEELDRFRKRYLERIQKQQERLKACQISIVFQSKRAQELKLNTELNNRLAELMQKGNHIDRICANFASGLTISERDQQRLDNAKEMYEVGKKITGIRFDYSAPPDVIKGYMKSEARRTLTPFSLRAEDAGEPMWRIIQGVPDKENRPHN